MTKNNNGQLSDAEAGELQTLVVEAEELAIANARLPATRRDRLTAPRTEAGVSAA